MYPSLLAIVGGFSMVAAFPGMEFNSVPRQVQVPPVNLPLSADEDNSGPFPNQGFNAADQFVDVRPGTAHQFVAPVQGDKRGPCPGLNAAANHGFLSHSGITTIVETTAGLNQAFGMGLDTATLLAILGVALAGNPVTQTWSIGGSYNEGLLGGILSSPGGLSNSHNKYESDGSATRYDAYLNGGNGNALEMFRFDNLYFSAASYTFDIIRDHAMWSRNYSVEHNPYFFSGVFAGLVPPVAHHFIIALMSNHSSAQPQGYLDRDILKSFFSVSGPDNGHVWQYGHEKIPQNWFRRPSSNPYSLPAVECACFCQLVSSSVPVRLDDKLLVALIVNADQPQSDLLIFALRDPGVIQVGGNTGTVNSFVGVDPSDLTGGVYNAQNLLVGNNLACYFFQATRLAVPQGLVPALSLLNTFLAPLLLSLSCPQLQWNLTALSQFPGSGYQPPVVPRT